MAPLVDAPRGSSTVQNLKLAPSSIMLRCCCWRGRIQALPLQALQGRLQRRRRSASCAIASSLFAPAARQEPSSLASSSLAGSVPSPTASLPVHLSFATRRALPPRETAHHARASRCYGC